MTDDRIRREREAFDAEVERLLGPTEMPELRGRLAQRLAEIFALASTADAVRMVLEEIARAGDAQEGIHPSPTLVLVKQTLHALREIS